MRSVRCLISSSTCRWRFFGNAPSKTSSTARSRRAATRRSCRCSMSSPRLTPGTSSTNSRARTGSTRRAAAPNGSSGSTGTGRARAICPLPLRRDELSTTTPCRMPPRPTHSGVPRRRIDASKIKAPAGSSLARVGSSWNWRATCCEGLAHRSRRARASDSSSSSGPTMRRRLVAEPATASAWSGVGTSRASGSVRSMASRMDAISESSGGSCSMKRSLRRPEPRRNERDQATPSAIEPTTISVEPPPTSTTPMSPACGSSSEATAPTNASRASSSPSMISRRTPDSASTCSASSSPFTASRVADVAIARTSRAP